MQTVADSCSSGEGNAFSVTSSRTVSSPVVTVVICVSQVYMACQSMLIVLVGSTPAYRIEQQEGVPSSQQRVTFTEDIDSIVTEVREPELTFNSAFTPTKASDSACALVCVSVFPSGFSSTSRPIRSV